MKRLVDITGSLTGLIIFAPVMLVLAFLVKKQFGAPVLYRSERPGKDGKSFLMLKFRTMRDAVDDQGQVLPDDQRLTPFGAKLRRSSLDELPELWNVLKGDMSLVGPRPLLMEYLPLYSKTQARRHNVRPGITGWAQVNGRNAISWEDKFAYDVWYVDNQTLWLDLKIIGKTLKKVIIQEGISQSGEATMRKFTGSKK
ncbi:MAG: sugar transferase [Rhodobacteraceae bacterium]|nr:sugar transferase [Paracoccaceae bacterium]